MPTVLLPLGVPTTLVQSQVYALPTRKHRIWASTTNAALEGSNAVGGTFTTIAVTANIAAENSAAFLRCTAASGIVVVLKAD